MRPYLEPRTREEALAELERCAGTQFDAGVVAAFAEVLAGGVAADAPYAPQRLLRSA